MLSGPRKRLLWPGALLLPLLPKSGIEWGKGRGRLLCIHLTTAGRCWSWSQILVQTLNSPHDWVSVFSFVKWRFWNERKRKWNCEKISFTIASERRTYTVVNLTKETKDLHIGSHETLMTGIKEDTNKRKDMPCSWAGRPGIVKVSILPKVICRFNAL